MRKSEAYDINKLSNFRGDILKAYALVGKSGTGKSHKAQLLARRYDISYIIDDGLLIKGNRVLAGSSAKREETAVAAIKRAIFWDLDHARKIKEKIREHNVDKILILGTSYKMILAICEVLEIPKPVKIIKIEDISTDREIQKARKTRFYDGKHVIPVPTMEIKKDFSGYLLDPLKIFYRKGKRFKIIDEKSVVRPTYSYLGKYTISDTTVGQIALHIAQEVPGIASGGRVIVENYETGIALYIQLNVYYGINLMKPLKEVQWRVINGVEYMSALNVLRVDVNAKKLVFRDNNL